MHFMDHLENDPKPRTELTLFGIVRWCLFLAQKPLASIHSRRMNWATRGPRWQAANGHIFRVPLLAYCCNRYWEDMYTRIPSYKMMQHSGTESTQPRTSFAYRQQSMTSIHPRRLLRFSLPLPTVRRSASWMIKSASRAVNQFWTHSQMNLVCRIIWYLPNHSGASVFFDLLVDKQFVRFSEESILKNLLFKYKWSWMELTYLKKLESS